MSSAICPNTKFCWLTSPPMEIIRAGPVCTRLSAAIQISKVLWLVANSALMTLLAAVLVPTRPPSIITPLSPVFQATLPVMSRSIGASLPDWSNAVLPLPVVNG